MIGWAGTLLAAWFLLLAVDGSSGVELCRRLTLTGLTEDNTAYVQLGLGGVFEVQDDEYNGFPVLKMNNIFFFYDEPNRWFAMGFKLGQLVFMGATVSSTFNKSTWLREANPSQPFDKAISQWFQVPIGSRKAVTLSGTVNLKCVDEDFYSCDSNHMAFNENLVQVTSTGDRISLNVPGQHYYVQLPHVFLNNRPVFEQKNGSEPVRLYYNKIRQGWVVGPRYPTEYAFLIARDEAWSPEYILSQWNMYTEGAMRPVSAKLRCLGVSTLLGDFCGNSNDTCQNGGQCHQLTTGEEICVCAEGFYGVTCEKRRTLCPVDNFSHDYFDVLRTGNRVGSIGTFFCNHGYEPKYFFGVCEATDSNNAVGEWNRTQECSLITTTEKTTKTTTTTTTTTTKKPTTTQATTTNWDDSWRTDKKKKQKPEEASWVFPVTLSMALIVQLILPSVIFYILYTRSDNLDFKEEMLKIQQYELMHQNLLTAKFDVLSALADGRMTEEEARVERGKIADRFTDLEQQNDKKRKKLKAKRSVKNISFGRAYSISFNVGLWVWLPLVITFSVLQLTNSSEVLRALWIAGIVNIVIGYLWILLESLCSREYYYIRKLDETGDVASYLKRLHETAPHLVMRATCYHTESHHGLVSYTDAAGLSKTKHVIDMKTIVTHKESELFHYGYWVDEFNDRFKLKKSFGVTKIKLKKNVIPGDEETWQRLHNAEFDFSDRNRERDKLYYYEREINLDSFEKKVIAYTDPENKSCWINKAFFWLATILCMSWPYRWLFRTCTGRARHTIEKKIFMNRPEQDDNVIAYNISPEQEALLTKDEEEQEPKEEKIKRKSAASTVKNMVDEELIAMTVQSSV